MVHGRPAGAALTPIVAGSAETVHYLCHETGKIDAWCPAGGLVSYFTVRHQDPESPRPDRWGGADATDPPRCQDQPGTCKAGELCEGTKKRYRCQSDGSFYDEDDDFPDGCSEVGGDCSADAACASKGACEASLTQWKALAADQPNITWFRADPEWRCTDPDRVRCDENRDDLREGKTFYEATPAAPPTFRSLEQAIDEAFRYRTRFRSRRADTSVGFVPQVCQGDAVPYCYDPTAIDEIADRVSCAANLYTDHLADLDTGVDGDGAPVAGGRADLAAVLTRAFGYAQTIEPDRPTPRIDFGFEHMRAELLIMLGDEAYTQAFAARFDLAGQLAASFKGSAFEPDGIDLAGGAGYEMFSLYQATQYYQLALERFFQLRNPLGDSLVGAFETAGGQRLITPETTVSWFDRLVRASSQKARAWAEIAKRYHRFDKPAVARRIIEKAFVSAYNESIFFTQVMKTVLDRSDAATRAQISKQIEVAQLTYTAALDEMKIIHGDIRDEVTLFGFSPRYVPFPPLDPLDVNAFEKLLPRARDAASAASVAESGALEDRREFDTDAAKFQSELTQIELDFTGQLGELCGWFEVDDGEGGVSVYPATADYARFDDDPETALKGDPCGQVGNGDLFEAIVGLEKAELAITQWKRQYNNLLDAQSDEIARVIEQCDRIEDFMDFRRVTGEFIIAADVVANALSALNDTLDRMYTIINDYADNAKCVVGFSTDCPGAVVEAGLDAAASVPYLASTGKIEAAQVVAQATKAQLELELEVELEAVEQECEELTIDGKYVVRDMSRQAQELALEGLQLEKDVQLSLGEVKRLRNLKTCIEATMKEQKALAVDIEAARNDPNVRIYKNDAILNADRTFRRAVREAWRLTRVYEYYTNSTYAGRQRLLLVRMIDHGDITLAAYLDELEDAFFDFEDSFGNPDLRVEVISLKDDALAIPHSDNATGLALSPAQREQLFQAALRGQPIDDNGYYVVKFRTELDRLSPLTINHKLRFAEVELVGVTPGALGDDLARIYLRQSGRGLGFVRSGEETPTAYELPQRVAVVNAFMDGRRPLQDSLRELDIDLYRNERLRDRPLHHSGWEVLLNFHDEHVNLDLDVAGMSDVRLYLWYTDFTEL